MNLPREIAWRYLRRPTDALVSAVGFVSIFGLVIGVMALVISMALMTGYRGDLQKKLLAGNAEVFVYSVGGPISDTGRLLQLIRTTPGVAEAAPVLFQHALVTTERKSILSLAINAIFTGKVLCRDAHRDVAGIAILQFTGRIGRAGFFAITRLDEARVKAGIKASHRHA